MKKFFNLTLSLLAAILVLASCSKNDSIAPENQDKGSEAMLTINFDNTKTRAVGTPTGETTITEGTILVFRAGSGILDGMVTFNSVASPVRVKITAGLRDVYVVANTNIDFSAVQNVSDLQNFTNKYALSTISGAGASLPMSGMALTQNVSAATLAAPAAVTVTLQYMCSKVNISWDIASLNPSMNSFTVTGAYIMNVPALTDAFAFGADNLTKYSTAFLTGINNFGAFTSGAFYPNTPFTNSYLADLNLADWTQASNGNNYFYVFENDPSTSLKPTIVVIQGTVNDNGTITTYYYPVVINGLQNTTGSDHTGKVVRGQSYFVKATIKGFGNTNPYEPITNAAMDVTIIPASWLAVINISQTFE